MLTASAAAARITPPSPSLTTRYYSYFRVNLFIFLTALHFNLQESIVRNLFIHNIHTMLRRYVLQGGLATYFCILAFVNSQGTLFKLSTKAPSSYSTLHPKHSTIFLCGSITNFSPVWVPTLPTVKSLSRGN